MRIFTEPFGMESLDQWTSVSSVVISTPTTWGGSFSYQATVTTHLKKTTDDTYDHLFFGFWFSNPHTNDNTQEVLAWKKGSTEIGKLTFNASSHKLEAYIGASLVDTGDIVFADGEERHFRIEITHDGSTGLVSVFVDGVEDIHFEGDTTNSEANIDGWDLIGGTSPSKYGAFVVNDDTTAVDNGLPAAGLRIRCRRPNGDGHYQNFDVNGNPPGGDPAFEQVDESGAPDDADIISTAENDVVQGLQFPSHGLIGATVQAVGFQYHMKTISGGAADHGVRDISGATDYFDGDPKTLTSSFKTYTFRYNENPATTDPWTLDEAQTNEFESEIKSVVS